jgi:nucleoside-diphosphate-sugar epimerase
MKVLVTGAAGFIGSHIAAQVSDAGHDVYALVRASTDLRRVQALAPSARLVVGDLDVPESYEGALETIRPDRCIHAAWYIEPGTYVLSDLNYELVGASVRLAQQLAALGCRRFVGLGTCLEYDTSFGYLSESTPTRPETPYAASKLALRLLLEQVGRQTGMEVAWARLFYQYGPFELRGRLVPDVICSLLAGREAHLSDGKPIRDFLHTADVASAIWAVAESELVGPVNVGSGRPITVREIATMIGTILGRPDRLLFDMIPPRTSDPPFICANIRRMVEATGWAPRYGLEERLLQTVNWWRDLG